MPFVPKDKRSGQDQPEATHAQTFVEYTLLIGIIVALLIAMMPLFRRGVQGLVKMVADQVGNQQDADQHGGLSGYLVNVQTLSELDINKTVQQRINVVGYVYDDAVDTFSNTATNLGFTEKDN